MKMNESVYTRSEQLLGEDILNKIKGMCVAVVGVGGVGGFATEALARLGVGKLVIIDKDVVSITNINRQIIASKETLGKPKVSIMKDRIRAINQEIEVVSYLDNFDASKASLILENGVDYVVDAIDSLSCKWDLIKLCLDNKIPFISSLGMGNRIDPSQIKITTLDKTSNDPLAKKLRLMARKENYDLGKINCVFSSEIPRVNLRPPSSIVLTPSVSGIYCASAFLNFVLYGK